MDPVAPCATHVSQQQREGRCDKARGEGLRGEARGEGLRGEAKGEGLRGEARGEGLRGKMRRDQTTDTPPFVCWPAAALNLWDRFDG